MRQPGPCPNGPSQRYRRARSRAPSDTCLPSSALPWVVLASLRPPRVRLSVLPSCRLPAFSLAPVGQSQRRLRRAPASDRDGVALSGCGLVVVGVSGWGVCPCPALFERTRNLTGVQVAVALGCAGVEFRRLHPHQNPGTGDLPGKDRPPNLGPGMCACAQPECRVPLTLAGQVEFHFYPGPPNRALFPVKFNHTITTAHRHLDNERAASRVPGK